MYETSLSVDTQTLGSPEKIFKRPKRQESKSRDGSRVERRESSESGRLRESELSGGDGSLSTKDVN